MISLSCSACAKKLSVKETLAGKKIKCPGCGQVLAVPAQVEAAVGSKQMRTLTPPAPEPSGQESRTVPPAEAGKAESWPTFSKPYPTRSGNRPATDHDPSLTDFLSPPQADDELGRLGKYRILKILGHGGMGVVFKAEDPRLKRFVALKAMLPALAASASAGQRFLREAQAMAAVEHDHIVRIYQVDEERGVPFLAMEFLKGEPLDERLKRQEQLPLGEVLRIGRQIAKGLGAAHATGLIHRDVKPGNVWLEDRHDPLSPGGQGEAEGARVKILDFGLARAVSGDAGLTQQGAILGTPAYMAPEQGRGDPVDARCDLFSLGVVLYRLCCGQLPFLGRDTVSTLVAVATHQPVPPIQRNPALPPELSELVSGCWKRTPGRRMASAGEVVQAMQALEKKLARQSETTDRTPVRHATDDQPVTLTVPGRVAPLQAARAVVPVSALASGSVPTKPGRKPRLQPAKKRWVLSGTGVALLLVGLLALWALGGFRLNTKNDSIVPENLTADAKVVVDEEQVVRQHAEEHKPIKIPGAPGERKPESKKEEIKTETKELPGSGGERVPSNLRPGTTTAPDKTAPEVVQKVESYLTLKGHTGDVNSVAYSPDGKRIVSASLDSTVKVWDADTGSETLTLKGHTGPVYSVAFSPDGKRIVSAGGDLDTKGYPFGEVKVWDADKGSETLSLKGHTGPVRSVAFSPDGKRIVSASWDRTVRVWHLQP